MKKTILASLLLVSTLLSFASQNRKVLIIGIDGTRSDAFQQANTPNIDGLLGTSLYTYNSWHTAITWSGPSWSTILTGVYWNKHGVTGNSFAGSNYTQYPPISTLAKQIRPNINSAIVAEWSPLIDNITNAGWNKTVQTTDGNTYETADSAAAQLQNTDLDFLFAYFDKVDLTGHSTTFSPSNPTYIKAIQQVDTAVGRVLNSLYSRPNYANEDWLILVVTDHGGSSFFHGGNSVQERNIWWIASGSAVAHQQINESDPGTYNCNTSLNFDTTCVDKVLLKKSPVHPDIAVTALHHLIYDSGVNPETNTTWNLDGKSWLVNPTSISETAFANSITVFPNPSSGAFTILCNNTNENTIVEVLDLAGRRMLLSEINTGTDRVAFQLTAQSGIYLLSIKNGSSRTIRKIQLLQ
jgi:hypothetical protein